MQTGLTPAEALRAATSAPAECLGQSDIAGSVSVGREADLVMLDGNPLENIGNTRLIDDIAADVARIAPEH